MHASLIVENRTSLEGEKFWMLRNAVAALSAIQLSLQSQAMRRIELARSELKKVKTWR